MKKILLIIGTLCIAAPALYLAGAAHESPPARPAASSATSTAPNSRMQISTAPSGDAGTDLVVKFYQALLQDAPPTREQELAIFADSSLRTRLVLGPPKDMKDLVDIEPMRQTPAQKEARQQQDAKVAAAGPVVLEAFRKHKDLFLPKNMKSTSEIQISSTYEYLRSLKDLKDPPKKGYGYVLVYFVQDRTVKPENIRWHAIVFPLWDGKLDPSAIDLDNHNMKFAEEEILGGM